MGFFSKLLGSNDWKKTLVRDLVTLTAVDGDMDKDEVSLAFKIATQDLGFTEQKFVSLMQNLGDVKDIYPTEMQDKLDYLQYLLEMTYVDGYVDDNEVEYMKIVAKRMNLPESSIDKAIVHVENTADEDENSNDSSIGKIIITSTFESSIDVQSVDGVKDYISRISKLDRNDLCIELSNVLASKHNRMMFPSNIQTSSGNQKIITDLNDKVFYICALVFGGDLILNNFNHNLREFNGLVNEIDEEIAKLQLGPKLHGKRMLELIHKNLK